MCNKKIKASIYIYYLKFFLPIFSTKLESSLVNIIIRSPNDESIISQSSLAFYDRITKGLNELPITQLPNKG